MRLTVLGACGAWPAAGEACSGFLVAADGFHLVLDLGYATVPRLLGEIDANDVDAVVISHGHPDHCADLNPLLRARALRDDPPPALPVYAPSGALDAVLALDRPGMLDDAVSVRAAAPEFAVGPFAVRTRLLPHFVPNVGVRLAVGDRVLAYTGDCGPSSEVAELARDADLLIAEATHLEPVPADVRGHLSSPRVAGRQAAAAGAKSLLLTHLWPGTDPAAAIAEAAAEYDGEITVAVSGLVKQLG